MASNKQKMQDFITSAQDEYSRTIIMCPILVATPQQGYRRAGSGHPKHDQEAGGPFIGKKTQQLQGLRLFSLGTKWLRKVMIGTGSENLCLD